MRKSKRFFAVLLSLCMSLSCAVSAFAAANFDDDGNRDEETGLTEEEQDIIINDSRPWHELDNPDDAYTEDLEYDEYIRLRDEYDETVKKLTSFGMWDQISDGSYLQPITAGEYCSIICRYINFSNVYLDTDTPEQKGEKAYDILKQQDIVDFELDPNDTITFDEAVRVLVNALGYKPLMQYIESDYTSLAISEDIVKRLPEDNSESITRLQAAYLLDDSIKADAYVFNGSGYDRVNALEHYKNIYELIDVVEAVDDVYVTKGGPAIGGIRIGSMTLSSSISSLMDYIGCRVIAYYESGYDGDILKYITYYQTDSMKTVEGYDILGCYDNEIEYINNGRQRTINLESDAVEILNGFSPSEIRSEDFENCDYIRLVDSDGNGRYDIVFVYKYDILVVERIVDNTIYGLLNNKPNSSIEVDFGSGELELVDRVGNPTDENYITKDSVLSVSKDPNSSKMRIIVSNMLYTGVIKGTSLDSDYSKTTIEFEDREYTYSTNYDYFRAIGGLKTGKQYTVLLDYRRRIAGFEEEKESELLYGYLIRAWYEIEGDERAVIHMLPYTGEMGNFMSAKNIVIDGINCDTSSEVMECMYTAAMNQISVLRTLDDQYISPEESDSKQLVYVRVPVLYRQNEDGEITYIDTPYHGASETVYDGNVFHDNTMTMYEPFSKRSGTATRPGGMYLRNTLAFNSDNGNNVAVDTNTKVFIVPVSNDTGVIRNPDNYQKSNLAYFNDWVYYPQTGTQYTVENRIEAYNVDESRVAEVIVYYTSDVVPEIDKKVPLTVVDQVIEAVNDEGEKVNRLVGYQGNAEITVDLADGVYLTKYYNGPEGEKITSTVRHGDIIRYVTNNKGELVDYVKVFSLKDEDDPNYVKVGNEWGTSADPAELNNTLLAVSDGKYVENGHNTPHIYNAVGSYNYGATYRVVYGTLLYRNGTNLVLKTTVDTAMGQTETTEIADFSGFNVLCIDEGSNRIYVPREDELLSAAEAGEDASKVILHTEGGKQRQLIIVKRAN